MAYSKPHLLSVNLEDYFQVAAMRQAVSTRHWPRFDQRIERNTIATLDMLDKNNVKATFFTLGWLAERRADLIQEIAARGHEIGSKGYFHKDFDPNDLDGFKEDAIRSKHAIENASGKAALGYRIANGTLPTDNLAAFEILAKAGYAYDSSVRPFGFGFRGKPEWQVTRDIEGKDWSLKEAPLSSLNIASIPFPVTGGNYARQMPKAMFDGLMNARVKNEDEPMHFYFHAWEMDLEQPQVTAISRLNQMRHYRNLTQMHDRIEQVVSTYEFAPIASHLELQAKAVAPVTVDDTKSVVSTRTIQTKTKASVVVPCYYEEETLPYLARTLASFTADNIDTLDLSFVLVDDGSKDRTWEVLNELFGDKPNYTLVQHPQNRGIAAATMTGIIAAKDEIVCGIDCDCSFDPHTLAQMIPLMTPEYDMVQASPYHKDGGVMNVPEWRLVLSRNLSRVYNILLNHRFASYTACFRVYRRSAIKDIVLDDEGFLGIAEMFIKLDQSGSKFVEFPTILEARIIGDSKMKTVPVIIAHLHMIRSLIGKKISAHFSSKSNDEPKEQAQ